MSVQTRNFPFRRNLSISPIMIPAGATASVVQLGALPKGVTSFGVVNSYPVHIRLIGTPMEASSPVLAGEGKGWLFPPGHFGIYSTQYPKAVSCIAVSRPGFPAFDANGAALFPDAALELFYGSGQ